MIMNFIKETFCDESGQMSSKRVFAGAIIVAVVTGWAFSVYANGLGEHETDLAETLIFVACILLGISPVTDAINGRRTRRNTPKIDESTENVETTNQ